MKMKKLMSLMVIGSVLFSGAAFAQDHEPVRAQDGSRTDQLGIPVRLRENPDIQNCVGEYREAREAFKQVLLQLRERLVVASEEDKVAIAEQIREQLRTHLGEQRAFRRDVRKIMRQLREHRNGPGTGTGG